MGIQLLFESEAQAEFLDAIAWYESEVPGLGDDFAHEVFAAIEVARRQPMRFRHIRGRARCIRLKRFKAYSIYFAIKENVFSVVAVFHGARNPADLAKRLR